MRSEKLAQYQFLFIRNDLPLLIQRKLFIAPAEGLGVVRRAIFFSLLAWLPIAIWAAYQGRFMTVGDTSEPLLMHFGIHMRGLIAIPLLILAEALALKIGFHIIPQFVTSGLVPDDQRGQFDQILLRAAKIRDAVLPWLIIFGVTLVWLLTSPADLSLHELSWASKRDGFGFGGWWFLYVTRTIFVILVLGWLWRMIMLTLLFWRISKLDLQLVPTHPDRMGGLGFLQTFPASLALVTFSMSLVLAGRWAHDSLYHHQALDSFQMPLAVFVVSWSLILLLPLLLFAPKMASTRRQALKDYRALLTKHGQLVHKRWILKQPVEQIELLDAPEIGPVADINQIYEAVEKMGTVPIGKMTILPVLAPIVIPMLFVAATQMPLKEVFKTLLKALL